MELTILEVLYIVLIIFVSVIGTLLTIILIKLLKVVKVASELADIYNKIKQVLGAYSKIPEIVKDTLKEKFVGNSKEKKEKK